MLDTTGAYTEVPPASVDSNGWVKSVPAGYQVIRRLSAPLVGGNFVCAYQGTGTLNISGGSVSNVTTTAGETRFTVATTYPSPQAATLSYAVNTSNYIRNIDCREDKAPNSEVLAPEFVSTLSTFKTVRFMKWQTATEGNWPVSWASRNKPGDGDYTRNDGVPIEILVQAANQAGADLWVTIPWNAEDDYITRFAKYVRDNLTAGHKVYVEVSNEVWNGSSPVASQATNEAKSEGLPSATGSGTGGNLERYAEKTKQVMAIWSAVFARQTARLVRVASFQHVSPYFSEHLLNYENFHASLDAVATAPYFGYEVTDRMSLDQIMGALPNDVTTAVDFGIQQKTIAQKFGLRYITYEAGQSVVLPNNTTLEREVERDQRMYDIYRQFLTRWQMQIGDSINLFALDGQIGRYGGWGLAEYVGQPITQTPKLRAVQEFLGRKPVRTSPPVVYSPTQVCRGNITLPIGHQCPSHQPPQRNKKPS
jgi:hypothetical protein